MGPIGVLECRDSFLHRAEYGCRCSGDDIDPAEFRRINCLKDGGRNATGQVVHNVELIDCIDAVTRIWNGITK